MFVNNITWSGTVKRNERMGMENLEPKTGRLFQEGAAAKVKS